jgi:hypothetical protein
MQPQQPNKLRVSLIHDIRKGNPKNGKTMNKKRNAKMNYNGLDIIEPWGIPFPTFCGFFLKFVMLQCGHMYSSPSVFA